MKNKLISPQVITLILVMFNLSSNAQTERDLENKYHSYHDRFRKHFTIISPEPGSSIPIVRLDEEFDVPVIPQDKINLHIPDNQKIVNKKGRVMYGDAMVDHGTYLMVLATEWRLRKWGGKDLTDLNNELYYALEAINRIDLHAEVYFNTNNSGQINGFLTRSDVPNGFYLPWEELGDPVSTATSGNGNGRIAIQKVKYTPYDINGNPLSEVDMWKDNKGNLIVESFLNHVSKPGEDVDYITGNWGNRGNELSQDHLMSLVAGLYFIHRYVDDVAVQPKPVDRSFNIVTEAKDIALRLVSHLASKKINLLPQIDVGNKCSGLTCNDEGYIEDVGLTCNCNISSVTARWIYSNPVNGRAVMRGPVSYAMGFGYPLKEIIAQMGVGTGFILDSDVEINKNGSDPNWGKISINQKLRFENLSVGVKSWEQFFNGSHKIIMGSCSGLLSHEDVAEIAKFYDFDWLELLYAQLNTKTPKKSRNYYFDLLTLAPCEGPSLTKTDADSMELFKMFIDWECESWMDRTIYLTKTVNEINGIISNNTTFSSIDTNLIKRFITFYKRLNREKGIWYKEDRTRISRHTHLPLGKFNGLDFMLYYNLYRITFFNEINLNYSTNFCPCKSENYFSTNGNPKNSIGYLNNFNHITEEITTKYRFPEYTDIKIFAPEFLTHDFEILDGGKLNVKGNFRVCNAILKVKNNGKLWIGTESDNKPKKFVVSRASTLSLDPGCQIIVHNNTTLIIEEGGSLIIGPNTQIILDGPNAILEIVGNLELLPTAVFAPIGGVNGFGFVRFSTAINDALTARNQMKLGNNSKMTFNGIDGKKVLEVREEKTLWLDEQNQSFTFEILKGKAEMGQNSTMNLASTVVFDHAEVDIMPTATLFNGVFVWYKTPVVKNSTFKHAKKGLATYAWINRTVKSDNNFFIENKVGWWNMGSGIDAMNNHFIDNQQEGILAMGQQLNSKIQSSTFTNTDINAIFYQSASTSSLTIRNSMLNQNANGIIFNGFSSLNIGCTKITGALSNYSQVGVEMKNGKLVLNNFGLAAAGRNDFTNHVIGILLNGKTTIYLNDGYNRLSNKNSFSDPQLSLYGKTSHRTSPLGAHRNRWNESFTGAVLPKNGNVSWPVGTLVDYYLDYMPIKNLISPLDLIDNSALSLNAYLNATLDCANPPVIFDPTIGNTNITINTSHYPNTPMHIAIWDVINKNYDTLIPKSDIVNRYAEILTYDGFQLPISAELYYFLELANSNLATALSDWSLTQPIFENGTLQLITFQEAIGVSNFWLATLSQDTNYYSLQFKNGVAINKGHFLHLANENILARNQFVEVVLWNDSNFIEEANTWICLIDRQIILEQDRANYFLIDTLPPCSNFNLNGELNKRNFANNGQSKSSNYVYNVYPNPAKNNVIVGIQLESEKILEIELIDVYGHTVIDSKVIVAKAGYTKVELMLNELRAGTYFIKIKSVDKTEYRKVSLIR